jgi:hypothetical protein
MRKGDIAASQTDVSRAGTICSYQSTKPTAQANLLLEQVGTGATTLRNFLKPFHLTFDAAPNRPALIAPAIRATTQGSHNLTAAMTGMGHK